MYSTVVSPIEALNAAIQSHNPFINAGIAKEQDVWGKGFPDVPTLNAHASDAVFQAIELVRTSQSRQDKVTSIAITAQQGVGKTHLISRIRHRLEREGGTLFVYAGVNNYTDLNLVKYQFQQTLADSLSHMGSQGVIQWQEVAAAMANEGKTSNSLTPRELVKKFDQAYEKSLAQNKNLMNALQKQVLKTKLNADPYIVRAILWTLSETQAPFAIKWLSGEELAQSNAEALGLPNPSKTSQEREAEALKNIQQILNLVSYYNPVLICFDEIDVKNNSTDDGLPTELVIANLVKILHDTVENSELGRGVVILTVMLPDTWIRKVNLMPGGIPDRVSKYTQRKPIDLKYVDAESMVDLVALWLKDFYQARKLTPPHPIYPFEESQLRKVGKGKPTVREALTWCAENFKDYDPLPSDPLERFELALTRELEADIKDYLKDNSLIGKAIYFGFETLKGQTMEGVTIEEVTNKVRQNGAKDNYINFKVIGKEKGKLVKIGVAVQQSSHHHALGATLDRLVDYNSFALTRGCLVRSNFEDKKLNRKAEYYKLLERLTSELGGELVELIEEHIRPLIAVRNVCKKSREYKLTEEQVFDFISQKQLTFENLLLQEILSDPSGQIPENAVEDDSQLLEDFLNPSNIDDTEDTEDSDDLSDLFN